MQTRQARRLPWLGLWQRCSSLLRLPPNDLLRDLVYRRLFASILISSLGGQITMLALPLTAALLLNASPTQMGLLTAMEIAPFVLFSLPAGVWLDRVRKLPVYIIGETLLALTVATVPIAAWMGWLTMTWLYVVGFVLGTVYTTAGSASQIVLTQVVERDRLVEAHAKNALASSGAEVVGPGVAGVLIKLMGAPMALAVDAALVLVSALILRGIQVKEVLKPREAGTRFWDELKGGLRFVRQHSLLVALAGAVGGWQVFNNAAQVVQILYATRSLGLSAQAVGMSYVALGAGTVLASVMGHRISARIGPGPSLVLGLATSGLGWLSLALLPTAWVGAPAFAFMLFMFGVGAVLIFINFLSLRQAVTPTAMLGRMTSTMRWLILVPAGPGALIGGWLGEHVSLRSSLLFAGVGALLVSLLAWRFGPIRGVLTLPTPEQDEEPVLGAEAMPGALGEAEIGGNPLPAEGARDGKT
ncbi:MFS family permease [Paucibacter oligotrophus]|uniref:MFS family permease n=1 Tax=Roseateles oligotrophus TaxID=1769250 RepID=A0A840LJE0_9BURK|nr:MFS transporter [Roseateles oligotrophus]MBB4846099.1 MFS family permease [Roseateles oligotrophus]